MMNGGNLKANINPNVVNFMIIRIDCLKTNNYGYLFENNGEYFYQKKEI